jgi:hypothetical protein
MIRQNIKTWLKKNGLAGYQAMYLNAFTGQAVLTLWHQNFLLNFSTPCI